MAELTHLDAGGAARMVDVGAKPTTERAATAEGTISMSDEAFAAIRSSVLRKGDALAVARVAGIMAAKRTADIVPLCHPLPLSSVEIGFDLAEAGVVKATATVRTAGRTGVEMEALTAVSAALLTIYDMAKSVDRAMVIGPIGLLRKSGGASGDFVAT